MTDLEQQQQQRPAGGQRLPWDDEQVVEVDTNLANIVVIDRIPVIGADKFDKLKGVLLKTLTGDAKKKNLHFDESRLVIPRDANGGTLGFMFLELPSKADADLFREAMTGVKFDAKHTFCVTILSEVERLRTRVPDEYSPMQVPEYKPKPNVWAWLQDRRGREQFLVWSEQTARISWKDAVLGNEKFCTVEGFAKEVEHDPDMQWSSFGTYLLVTRKDGLVEVRGGAKDLDVLVSLPLEHMPGVPPMAHFTAAEKYVVTWSNYPRVDPAEPGKLTIWDISTGLECRSFSDIKVFEEIDVGTGCNILVASNWPVFQWSHDDKYFARIADDRNALLIYETVTWRLVGDRKIDTPAVGGFSWSPSSNVLAYWVPEADGLPARVVLLSVPDMIEIKKKTIFKVESLTLDWHPQGTYLMSRAIRSSGAAGTSIDILRLKVKDIPVESLTLPSTDRITACLFEPYGDRFAIVLQVPTGLTGSDTAEVRFYSLEKMKLKQEGVVKRNNCEQLYWSPRGRFCVLWGLDKILAGASTPGTFDIVDVQDNCTVTGSGKHFRSNRQTWDPSGRFFATALTYTKKTSTDLGYCMWNLRGKMLDNVHESMLWEFAWRPRPPLQGVILSDDDVRKARASVKDKSARYEREDKMLAAALSDEEIARRQAQMDEFSKWKMQWEATAVEHRDWLRERRVLLEPESARDFVELVEESERVMEVEEAVVVDDDDAAAAAAVDSAAISSSSVASEKAAGSEAAGDAAGSK